MSFFKRTDPRPRCDHCAACEQRLAICNQRIDRLLKMLDELVEIIRTLLLHPATHATLHFTSGGITLMPASIVVGKTATAVFTEFDGGGNKVPPVGAVTFTSDNAAVATVDPASGIATGVSVGTANISAIDAGNNLTASDALTVTADVATTATLVLTANP